MLHIIPKKMTVQEMRAYLMLLLDESGEWSKTDIGEIFNVDKSTASRTITSAKNKKNE